MLHQRLRSMGLGAVVGGLAMAIALMLAQGTVAKDGNWIQRRAEKERTRFALFETEAFWNILGVRPGMTVLDIGAGTGVLALRAAELVGPGGTVFATDILPEMVEAMETAARERGLGNLRAVEVSAAGLDPFYTRQHYDLIIAVNTSVFKQPNVAYFRDLRAQLSPGGRLVGGFSSELPFIAPYQEDDFRDFNGLVNELAREPPTSPFVAGLSPPVRESLGVERSSDAEPAFRAALLRDIQRMLSDPFFGKPFVVDGKLADPRFPDRETELYASWLLRPNLYERIYPDGPSRPPGVQELNYSHRLNNRLFIRRFGQFLSPQRLSPYWPGRETSAAREFRRGVTEIVERAGWSLAEESYEVPFYVFFVFR